MFWIAYQYGIIDNRANIINALLLKWCNEGRITFVKRSKYVINDINKEFNDRNEASLFELIVSKSRNKFIKLTMFNYNSILRKVNDILLAETNMFRMEKKIIKYKGVDIISNCIEEDVDIVFGFRNFLLNFGDIDDKSPQEVQLWDEYLIYAELLGIADKVKKEFRKVNIDYSFREAGFNLFTKLGMIFFRLLLCFSYFIYGGLFIIFTGIIWGVYANFTWYNGFEYIINWVLQYMMN